MGQRECGFRFLVESRPCASNFPFRSMPTNAYIRCRGIEGTSLLNSYTIRLIERSL